jgi:hypothetical protein
MKQKRMCARIHMDPTNKQKARASKKKIFKRGRTQAAVKKTAK